jgi:two-component system sensor histidine kinase/response regulator
MVTDTEEASYPPASILIVDDNPANLLALMAVLEALGHRVVKARSGEEALRRVMDEEFAAVLVDVQMPGMDGFQTVSLLREHPRVRHTPMVFLSAYHHDLVAALKGYAAGAIDYIVKPFEPDLLRAKVQSMVSLYRRGEELKRRAAIIAQKELEATRAQSEAQRAEEASRLKDKYIGILGHDLRNPLSAIANSAQLLLRSDDLPERHKKSSARILRAANRMSDMISDVLDFTRGHLGGGIPVEPTEGDLAEICHRVVDETKAINPQREIAFNATGDLSGRWDRPRLEQVISNLLGNAVRHGEGRIDVEAVGEDGQIALMVRNQGRPIPADQISTIFEPFRRVASGPEGLGLGLYIVKEIVRAHGGTIEVRSSADEGTTFACLWRRNGAPARPLLASPSPL